MCTCGSLIEGYGCGQQCMRVLEFSVGMTFKNLKFYSKAFFDSIRKFRPPKINCYTVLLRSKTCSRSAMEYSHHGLFSHTSLHRESTDSLIITQYGSIVYIGNAMGGPAL